MFENAGYKLKMDFEDCEITAFPQAKLYAPKKITTRTHQLSIYENPKRAQGGGPVITLFCYKYLGGEWKYIGNGKCRR
jgi:hypothetical protein